MIKTTHPMNCDFIKLSCTALDDAAAQKVTDTYDKYNEVLKTLIPKLSPNISNTFYADGPELIMPNDIIVNDIEIDEDAVKLNIKAFFHNQDMDAQGSLLFSGVSSIQAEFDDSPVTNDYLEELFNDRDILDIIFDILPNGETVVDIYSLNEEPEEYGKDDDDFQILHVQIKFKNFSTDLEATKPAVEKVENIDAMDTFEE